MSSEHHEQPLLIVEGLNAYYGSAHVLQDVSFELGEQAVAIVGRNGMGKTTLCAAIMGISPPRATGLGEASRARSSSAGPRTRSPGSASATCRRGAGCSRRSPWTSTCAWPRAPERRQALDDGRRLRAVPAARRAEAERRRAAVRRRAADARDRARARHEPEAADHGRALRGARADDHRDADRDLPQARGGGAADPADRAEPRHGDLDRRPAAGDGGRRDRRGDDRGAARGRSRAPAAISRRRAGHGTDDAPAALSIAALAALFVAGVRWRLESEGAARARLRQHEGRRLRDLRRRRRRQARAAADRGEGRPVHPARLFFQIEPHWSPDGKEIAFVERRDGDGARLRHERRRHRHAAADGHEAGRRPSDVVARRQADRLRPGGCALSSVARRRRTRRGGSGSGSAAPPTRPSRRTGR